MKPVTLISDTTFTLLGASAFFTLILPLVAMLFLIAMKKLQLKPVLAGAAAFFISQMILRMPLIRMIAGAVGEEKYIAFAGGALGIFLIGGISAGLFEETARLVCGKYIFSKDNGFKTALAFGLGYGLCECILLVGMSQINMILNGVAINDGSYLAALQEAMAANPGYYPDDYFQQVINEYNSVTAITCTCAVLERAAAVAFHTFASLIVFKGAKENKLWLWEIAILLHAAFNFIGVMAGQSFGVVAGTAIILLMGAGCFAGILYIKPKAQKREMI